MVPSHVKSVFSHSRDCEYSLIEISVNIILKFAPLLENAEVDVELQKDKNIAVAENHEVYANDVDENIIKMNSRGYFGGHHYEFEDKSHL